MTHDANKERTPTSSLAALSPACARLLAAHSGRLKHARPLNLAAVWRATSRPDANVRKILRLARQRLFVHSANDELNGGSPVDAGRRWSDFADAAVLIADRVAYQAIVTRYGVPRRPDGVEMGRAVFALGKHGSRELNPSSDIDLLFAYETDHGVAGEKSPHEFFVRWVRLVREILSDVDEHGFVFRVDLDLRPEGTVGPLVNSVDAMEAYYERFGLTWERAALTRLRPVVDAGGVGVTFQDRIRPFVFPRSANPRVVDEMGDMRARIEATATQDGFDVKRSAGGIRDVEFMIQALQLVYAGRVSSLRGLSTLELIAELERVGFLPHRTARELHSAYVFLRRVEHAIQYHDDRQTQILPTDDVALSAVARFVARGAKLPRRNEVAFHEELLRVRGRARAAMSELFSRDVASVSLGEIAIDRAASTEERHAALRKLGIAEPELALTQISLLARRRASPFSPTRLKERPSSARLAAQLVEEAARSPHPLRALERMADLFSGPLTLTLVDALTDDARLRSLLVRVLAVSAPLSRVLLRLPETNAILLEVGRPPRLRAPVVLRALTVDEAALHHLDDDERPLAAMRRVRDRAMLAAGLAFFDGRMGVFEVGLELSRLGDVMLRRALAIATERLHRRHGAPSPSFDLSICALGRLGSRELGFASDLDLVFVYDGDGESDGARKIGVAEYAARLAQQTISMLSMPLSSGVCYQVDTRLRPSGNQGPLCVQIDAFRRYHDAASALWERQTLTRLRPVTGQSVLKQKVVDVVRGAISKPSTDIGAALLDMRARMVDERAAAHGFDLKLSEGGIADVEFAVQGIILANAKRLPQVMTPSTRRAISRLTQLGLLKPTDGAALARLYARHMALRELLALVDDNNGAGISRLDSRLELLARTGALGREVTSGSALFDETITNAARVRELTSRILIRLDP